MHSAKVRWSASGIHMAEWSDAREMEGVLRTGIFFAVVLYLLVTALKGGSII
ncbi:hypothetical protein HY995_01435 [Candidatus Micrarchaeota archaeon]|nr:hypothetical protein [Candidatus Micrarchaeota archaeon]